MAKKYNKIYIDLPYYFLLRQKIIQYFYSAPKKIYKIYIDLPIYINFFTYQYVFKTIPYTILFIFFLSNVYMLLIFLAPVDN